ncbi:MAG: hypothetical protein KF866_03170 [Phycisphaeraceae bacterium]|nr:hypothetical protein [Phycisphaeraceae bacterium]
MNVVLMGLRGSGKSTLGIRLAQALGRPFLDLDEVTPRLLGGVHVADVWNTHGQKAFREAEVRALEESLSTDGRVIALGGGTPTAPNAAKRLQEGQDRGELMLIYLRANAVTLRERLKNAGNTHRPSLTGSDVLDEIDAVHEVRDPHYRGLASVVIEIDGCDEASVLATLVRICRNRGVNAR